MLEIVLTGRPHLTVVRESTEGRIVAIGCGSCQERGTLWHHAPKPGINGVGKVERFEVLCASTRFGNESVRHYKLVGDRSDIST